MRCGSSTSSRRFPHARLLEAARPLTAGVNQGSPHRIPAREGNSEWRPHRGTFVALRDWYSWRLEGANGPAFSVYQLDGSGEFLPGSLSDQKSVARYQVV